MTVTNTSYSSLEEVWGESFGPSNKSKKEKKKKVVDPICELYEMGNNNGYTENDLVSFANSYYDKRKSDEYNRTMNDSDDVIPRERDIRNVAVYKNKNMYDVTDHDDVDYTRHEPVHTNPKRLEKNNHAYNSFEDDDENEHRNGFAFIDLLLYIVSGIILIFVMEQFVKIGLLLQ